jgi:alkyldihydroxyacetonephosphate synthase
MRRWNGWGDESHDYTVPTSAGHFLEARIGPTRPLPDATIDDVLRTVPATRLPDHPMVITTERDRLMHARGQSLGDWLRMRSGKFEIFPDGVAYPSSGEQVRAVLDWAAQHNVRVIPYGGGTSVAGHITPLPGDRPVLTVDLSRLNQLSDLDTESHLATIGAGANGPQLESQLRARGYTLGHFPQSFELSTLGGWVVTRSSGQQSLRYGRIEDLFAGGRMETPVGTLDVPPLPASGAGTDIREIVLGSEGRFGILTDVTVRVTPQAPVEQFHTVFFPSWEQGTAAMRVMAQMRVPLSMLRLSNPVETETQLALAGRERVIGLLERFLDRRGAGQGRTMMMMGVTGSADQVRHAKRQAIAIARRYGGVPIGQVIGKQWQKSRFHLPYIRHGMWERGVAIDTLETATHWSNVTTLMNAIEEALRSAIASDDERVHVFTHLSHVYTSGCSIYTTYLYRCAPDYDETEDRWRRLKAAASEAIVAHGGTISHQHGVGLDHAPYLPAEKGELGMRAIKALAREFDPGLIMNPGKLFP